MSLAAACGWALFRSLVVVLVGWPMCTASRGLILRSSGVWRRIAWFLALLPFLFPGLLSGYAYAGSALQWGGWFAAHDQMVNEFLYGLLLLFKSVPVGIVVLYFSPPAPLSAAAAHCRRLAIRPNERLIEKIRVHLSLYRHGSLRAAFPALALMWLTAFQDFEVASLLNAPSWTVWLFDAQAQGIRLGDSLRFALLPLVLQILVIAPLSISAYRTRHLRAGSEQRGPERRTLRDIAAWSYLTIGATVGSFIPICLVGENAAQGLAALLREGSQLALLGREIRSGLVFAVSSALLSLVLGALLLTSCTRIAAWLHATIILVTVIPGLLSSLIISLLTLALFQRTPLSIAYGTPFPITFALTIFLLPRALIVELLWSSVRGDESAHLGRLLDHSRKAAHRRSAGEILWRMKWRRQFFGASLVAWWGYLELTIASLLAPAAMVPATVRLYNQMHFGRNATLAAMTCLTVFVPLVLMLTLLALRRPCWWLIRR